MQWEPMKDFAEICKILHYQGQDQHCPIDKRYRNNINYIDIEIMQAT